MKTRNTLKKKIGKRETNKTRHNAPNSLSYLGRKIFCFCLFSFFHSQFLHDLFFCLYFLGTILTASRQQQHIMGKLVHNVQKKQHRERAQISSRARFGLLEKKKDYKLRSENFHKNQAKLKLLKEKAKNYNEDEYYHAMINKKTNEDGILIQDREFSKSLSNDEVLLLKGQDLNYLNTITSQESKKIEKAKLQASIFGSNGKHTVFVEDKTQFDNFKPEEYFQTSKELLGRRENRLKKSQLINTNIALDQDTESLEESLAHKRRELDILKQRIEREKKLNNVRSKLELQRELMKPGSKKKLVKNGQVVYKWKNERKK